jgi:hypothetical protein
MSTEIVKYNYCGENVCCVFVIGRVLNGHVDDTRQKIFGLGLNYAFYGPLANQVVEFYNFQLTSYRKAVDTWVLVGMRFNVVKDIRKLIGKMIWDARKEAKYT